MRRRKKRTNQKLIVRTRVRKMKPKLAFQDADARVVEDLAQVKDADLVVEDPAQVEDEDQEVEGQVVEDQEAEDPAEDVDPEEAMDTLLDGETLGTEDDQEATMAKKSRSRLLAEVRAI